MVFIPQSVRCMIPYRVLKVNKAANLRKESCHTGTTEVVVPFLGGGGMDRAELVWRHEIVDGVWIEANSTRSWLSAACPSRPIIPRKGHIVAQNGLIRPIRGKDRVGDRWPRRRSNGVSSRCRRCHLGENGKKNLEMS